MKKEITSAVAAVLLLALCLCLGACNTVKKTGLWEEATYLSDQTLGTGKKTITVEVTAEEQTVTFTVKTDCDTVGAALLDLGLIDGDQGPYGIYIKKVNGITADYDVDQTYWTFYVNGEMSMSGADMTAIDESAVYRFAHAR